ncbi:ATP-binding protein [Actinomadura sp. KC216]|uniref:AlbA family DNA-binding domain-containing protein n=1 Tax=Actinomadura sp. KC216 TaxID=2530370 RepID=UPI001404A3B4|nr:ATP-binding protein [Actinomadura sp. KC216]
MFRSPRLEALFGKRIDLLTFADVQALVGRDEATEAADLDYKELVHAKNDEQKVEFCKDVAAMANDRGGVLMIGIKEDGQRAVPAVITKVDVTDAEQRRLYAVLSNIAPWPLPVDILAVEDPSDQGRGVLLVTVERSALAPHAIFDNRQKEGWLRYPIRAGASTRWMQEPEVATRYRARFTEARGLAERLDAVEEEAFVAYTDLFPMTESIKTLELQLWRPIIPVLSIALVPENPGSLRINREVYQDFQMEAHSSKTIHGDVFFSQARVAAGRLVAISGGGSSPNRYAEFHADGSGALLIHLEPSVLQKAGKREILPISLPYVTLLLLSGLLLLGKHSRDRTRASGAVSIRFRLVADVGLVRSFPVWVTARSEQLPLEIQDGNGWGTGHRTEEAHGAATAFVDDIAEEGHELLSVGSLLADQAVHAFGLPEVPLITPDGELVPAAWGRLRGEITEWGTRVGLLNT